MRARAPISAGLLALVPLLAACSSSPAPACQTSTPPSVLYQDYCAGSDSTVCFVDHVPTDGF